MEMVEEEESWRPCSSSRRRESDAHEVSPTSDSETEDIEEATERLITVSSEVP